jgi:hypothetical protein
MTPPLVQRQTRSQGAVPVFHPAAGDAPGHRLRGSLEEMARPIWQPASVAGTNKTGPPSIASRTAENRPPGIHDMHQSDWQSGRPRNGTKRARIGIASGSTDRLLCPDAVRYMSVTIATR